LGGIEALRGAFAAASKGGKDYAMILEALGGAAGKTDADFQTMKGSLENTLKALDTSFQEPKRSAGHGVWANGCYCRSRYNQSSQWLC
jgi:hypothetical protein